jgi:hypothetical protein
MKSHHFYKPKPNLISSVNKSEARIETVHFCITADLWPTNHVTVTNNFLPAKLNVYSCVTPVELLLEE